MIDYETNNNNHHNIPSSSSSDPVTHKRKRRPAGTPDPEAEVISLSPRTLLESDRYICEICSQGFQRDQNLQMHRRRHKVPWKLLKREKKEEEVKKRVYVCPEPTCLHHDPCHALGDLVGIKKHYRRKHSVHKQWVCQRCSKAYAVQSDYKAHLKTCGSRGHSCDCGRVFSRVESFIEHQDNCTIRRSPATSHRQDQQAAAATIPATPSTDNDLNIGPLLYGFPLLKHSAALISPFNNTSSAQSESLELQLRPSLNSNEIHETSLNLWIGTDDKSSRAVSPKEKADEEMKKAEEARREAKRQREMAETEFENAKRLRKEAKAELEKAHVLREEAIKRINATMMHITCHSCKLLFHVPLNGEDTTTSSLAVSSATTEGECL